MRQKRALVGKRWRGKENQRSAEALFLQERCEWQRRCAPGNRERRARRPCFAKAPSGGGARPPQARRTVAPMGQIGSAGRAQPAETRANTSARGARCRLGRAPHARVPIR
jgi:hypothetical protein